jgi:hypothetical protein
MTVIQWHERDDPYAANHGITETWLEIDERGFVTREIGFTADGSVRHKFPGDEPFGRFGIYDLASFDPSTPADLLPRSSSG